MDQINTLLKKFRLANIKDNKIVREGGRNVKVERYRILIVRELLKYKKIMVLDEP